MRVLPDKYQRAMNRYKREQKRRREDPDLEPFPEGNALTFEKWNELCTQANPLDSFAREQKEQRERLAQPPWVSRFDEEKSDWRNDDGYILNHGERDIASMVYSLFLHERGEGYVSGILVFRVKDIPAYTPFKVKDASGQPTKHGRLRVHVIEWENGETWTGDCNPEELYHAGNAVSIENEEDPVDRIPELLAEVDLRRGEEA
jgi:hypothetical protein